MSRSLFISLLAAGVAGSAQAVSLEQVSQFCSSASKTVAPYITPKTAGVLAATGVVGYGLKRAISAYRNSASTDSLTTDTNSKRCKELTEKMRKRGNDRSIASRVWANRPSVKSVCMVAATAAVVGGGYYFRSGISNIVSKIWNMFPAKAAAVVAQVVVPAPVTPVVETVVTPGQNS
jgi:hypothetical protein